MQRREAITVFSFLQIILFYAVICESLLFHQTSCAKKTLHYKIAHGHWPRTRVPRTELFATTEEQEASSTFSILKRIFASISAGILVSSNGVHCQAAADDNVDVKDVSESSLVVSDLTTPSIFPFVKPSLDQSKLLTTTIRFLNSDAESSSVGGNTFKKLFQVNENLAPNFAAIYDSLPNWLTSYSGQIFAAGFSAIILADRLTVGSDLSALCEEQAKNITLLTTQLQSLSKSSVSLDVPANSTSSIATSSTLNGELQSRLEQLSESFEERGLEIQKLRNAIEELQRDILTQAPPIPSSITTNSPLLRDLSSKNQQLETQVTRFKADAERYQQSVKQLMDATKTFLVKKNLLAQGLVNMLLPSTAADVLLQAADKPTDPKADKDLNELQNKLQQAASEIAGAQDQKQQLALQLQQSKDQLKQQSSSWQQREEALTQKQKELEQELLLQTKSRAADNDKVVQLKDKLQKSEDQLQQLTHQVNNLQQQQQIVQSELAQARADNDVFKNKAETLLAQMTALDRDVRKVMKDNELALQAAAAETATIKQERDKALEKSIALSQELEQAKEQLATNAKGSVVADSGDSKLDSARAMAKELNAMLKAKEGQLGNCKFKIFSTGIVVAKALS